GFEFDSKTARYDPRNIQQIFDQLRLGSRIPVDNFDSPLLTISAQFAAHHHATPSQDCSHRRAQLMPDRRQEFIIRDTRFFRLAAGFLRLAQRLTLATFRALLFSDVARNIRHPDNASKTVTNGRDRLRDFDSRSVLSPALGFVVIDPLSTTNAPE